ncbi:hypothetical protein [Actinoalloteichus hymeniacidonis]|uniref:hypothetical protein n=1 Tax=Actinoalloteichus hymeniacidonis TaxID=340345 RepID=UPI001560EC42|nr:hypothetical protein [Actinoalloteichus hymeniacidonis]MBB5906204.1 hypothetical protein [Actinoalloteichus hymeniacidonis]
MERKLREYLPRYAKKVETDFPLAAHDVAMERARVSLPAGSAGDSPSTSVWRLLDLILQER